MLDRGILRRHNLVAIAVAAIAAVVSVEVITLTRKKHGE